MSSLLDEVGCNSTDSVARETNGRCASANEYMATVWMERRVHVCIMRSEISERFDIKSFLIRLLFRLLVVLSILIYLINMIRWRGNRL